MVDLFLINTQIFVSKTLIDELESCGLLWCFYQLFELSIWWHPFSEVSKFVTMKKETRLHPEWPKIIYLISQDHALITSILIVFSWIIVVEFHIILMNIIRSHYRQLFCGVAFFCTFLFYYYNHKLMQHAFTCSAYKVLPNIIVDSHCNGYL